MNFRHQILNILHSAAESRTTLAQQMGVTKAWVTRLTAELIDERIISEASQKEIPFGRPATLLTVVSGNYFSINILIRDNLLHATLNDYNTTVAALADTRRVLTEKISAEELIATIDNVINQLTATAGVMRDQVRQISLALQGGIEQDSGIVRWCPVFDAREIALKAALESACQMQVSVVNIAWCSCYMLSRSGQGEGSWLALMPGYGSLGFGYYLNGRPVLGENGFYPEIVHLPYEGGLENAFKFNANAPESSGQKAADALFFAICCTAPVHNIRKILLSGEFFDEAPEWVIPLVRQRLLEHPNERINRIQLHHILAAPGLSHAGLVKLSSDAMSAIL